MRNTLSKRTYKCKCGNAQEEFAWDNELVGIKFKCNSCSGKLDHSNLKKKEVPQSAAIRTPTKNR